MIIKSGTNRKIEHFKERLGMVGDVYVIDHYISDRLAHQKRFENGFAQKLNLMEKETANFLKMYEQSTKLTTIALKDQRDQASKNLGFYIGLCAEDQVYDFSDEKIENINEQDFLVLIIGSTWKYSNAPLTIIGPRGKCEYNSFADSLSQEIYIPIFRTVEIICRNEEDNPKHLIFEVRNYG